RKPSFWYSLVWHALGASLLVGLTVAWLGPWTVLDPKFTPFIAGLAGTYLATAATAGLLVWRSGDGRTAGLAWALLPTTAFLTFLLGSEAAYSRVCLGAALAVLPFLVASPLALRGAGRWIGLTALAVGCAASVALSLRAPTPAPAPPRIEDRVFTTSSYTV